MGRDKALLPFRGATLAGTVAEAVGAAAGSVRLVGSLSYGELGYGIVPDGYPGEGPLGGILTALDHSPADWNLIVACDMPALSADFLRQLLDAAGASGAGVLLPADPSGRLQPLCAVYHRSSRQGLGAAFARGVRKVAEALEEVACAPGPITEAFYFQNVNTPEDWAAYGR
jgi:molybdopterin-guanine dinucleotide biosynthesis protein A